MDIQENQISVELREAVRKNVPATEKIIWTGKPEIRLFKPTDWLQVPFMIVWTGLAGFIGITAVCSGAPVLPFALLPAIFVCIGLYQLVGQRIIAYLYLRNCAFVLTENCAFTISTFPSPQTRSTPIHNTTSVTVAQKGGRPFAIYFEDIPAWAVAQRDPAGWNVITSKNALPAFFYIQDAQPAIDFLKVRARVRTEEVQGFASQMVASGGLPAGIAVMPTQRGNAPAMQAGSEFALLPDETIIWQGKPEPGLRIRKGELMASPLLIVMAALLSCPVYYFIQVSAATKVSFLIVCVAMTALLLALSAISEIMIKRNTRYAITNKRVLQLCTQAPKVVRSYAIDLNQINSVHSSSNNDDSGMIVFNRKNSFLVKTFGAEGVTLDPLLTSRREPFLLDVPKARSVARLIEQQRIAAKPSLSRTSAGPGAGPGAGVGAGLGAGSGADADASAGEAARKKQYVTRRAPRQLPEGTANQLAFGSSAFGLTAFTAGVATFVGAGHMAGYGWSQLQELIKLLQSGKFVVESGFPPIGFLIPVALFVVAACIIANHVISTRKQLSLLRMGTATTGTYITERVVGKKNNQAWLIEREFEFFDRDGVRRNSKSLVNAQSPIKREVTILFDVADPDNSVVIDDLAGGLTLGQGDDLKRKSKA